MIIGCPKNCIFPIKSWILSHKKLQISTFSWDKTQLFMRKKYVIFLGPDAILLQSVWDIMEDIRCPKKSVSVSKHFFLGHRHKPWMHNELWCQRKVDCLVQYLQLLKDYLHHELMSVPEKPDFGQTHVFWDIQYIYSIHRFWSVHQFIKQTYYY